MRSLIALSLVSGLATPALARPENDRPPPPSVMRPEVQMRIPTDGRGDTYAPLRESRPESWQRAERPSQDRAPTGAQRMDLPFKSDVAQKAHPGDSREMAPKPQGLDARAQNNKPATDRMGRPEQKPALPIKTEILMKQEHGDNRDSATAPSAASAAKQSSTAPKSSAAKMTAHDREMLCKMSGVCLPQAHATDDVEDKTE